jgi:hypothetical protein
MITHSQNPQNIAKTQIYPPPPPPIIISTPKIAKKTKKKTFSCRKMGPHTPPKKKPPPLFRIFAPKNELWSGGVLEKWGSVDAPQGIFYTFLQVPPFLGNFALKTSNMNWKNAFFWKTWKPPLPPWGVPLTRSAQNGPAVRRIDNNFII